MNGIHDMGGMHGFGPVPIETDEPVFHEPWEGRVYAMAIAAGQKRLMAPGGLRPFIEELDPARYLRSSYYERWMGALEDALIRKGVTTKEDIDRRTAHFAENPESEPERREDPEQASTMAAAIYRHRSPQRETEAEPRFKVGDRVRARTINPQGHTRLPRYIRGRSGVVTLLHGVHSFDDTKAQGLGPQPQHIYNVRFEARELWGEEASETESVYIDMWDSYLDSED